MSFREEIDWGGPVAPSTPMASKSRFTADAKQDMQAQLDMFDPPYESYGSGPVFTKTRGGGGESNPDDMLTDEDDDLSNDSIEAENNLHIEKKEGGDNDNDDQYEEEEERNFMAIKPWLGAMAKPTDAPVMTEEEGDNNWAEPNAKLDLDYVFGYRSRNARQNLHWIDDTHVLFSAAAVGVVLDVKTTDQDFFFGHDDDIICVDYHHERRLACSGSIGARNEVRLCVWRVDQKKGKDMFNPLEQVRCWQGFHQFGVAGVAFSPDGSLVASFGMDEHHSVAIYSVDRDPKSDSGLQPLLAISPADKSRLIHLKWNTSLGVDSNTCFVTVGVKHICFWTPKAASTKNKNYYEIEGAAEIDQRLDWQRGFGCKEIDDLVFYSISNTSLYTLVGASNGSVYVFHSTAFDMRLKVDISPTRNRILSLLAMNSSGDTFAAGDGAGLIRFFDISADKNAAVVDVCKSAVVSTGNGGDIDLNGLDSATDNASDIQVNSVRSMCYHAPSDKLLIGTILSQIYSVDIAKSPGGRKLSHRVLLSGHWGSLREKEGYGELWGVAASPDKQQMYTCSDDGTVRLWDVISNKILARHNLKYCCMKVDVSNDGSMVAVGHRNGSFTVLSGDLKTVLHPNTRHRKKRVMFVRFSPNSKMLAVGSDSSIDLYTVRQKKKQEISAAAGGSAAKPKPGTVTATGGIMARTAICRGHTALVSGLDWNISSTLMQTTSKGYELLYFAKDGSHVTGAHSLRDQIWFTQTCALGWSVQGIWPRFADGSDINSVGKSHSERYLAITNDWGKVRLFNYPCVGSGMDKVGKVEHRPDSSSYSGHCSHVTNCVWTFDDSYLLTTGGADLCVMAWKVAYNNPQGGAHTPRPTKFLNAQSAKKFEDEVQAARAQRASEDQHEKKEREAEGITEDDAEAQKMQDALQNDPLASLQPKMCVLCGHKFLNFDVQTCPRCNTPRRLTFSEPHLAWGGKKKVLQFGSAFGPGGVKKMQSAYKSGGGSGGAVQGRHHHNTKTFLESSRQQKELRRTVERVNRAKPKTWQPNGNGKAPFMPLPEDDPDTDDELLKKKVTYKAKKITGATSSAPKKRTTGVDFEDY